MFHKFHADVTAEHALVFYKEIHQNCVHDHDGVVGHISFSIDSHMGLKEFRDKQVQSR